MHTLNSETVIFHKKIHFNYVELLPELKKGWNYTRVSDVSLQRLGPSGDILNSVVLVTSSGCVHPKMRSICPLPPTFEPPLGHRLGFRAVMFQGMRSGDEMVMSVKIAGCLEQNDCFVVRSCIRWKKWFFLRN